MHRWPECGHEAPVLSKRQDVTFHRPSNSNHHLHYSHPGPYSLHTIVAHEHYCRCPSGGTMSPVTCLRGCVQLLQMLAVTCLLLVQVSLAKEDENEHNQVTDCLHDFGSSQSKNGTFSSPHFPNPYPSDFQCRYSFHGSGRERVQIIFTELDLNYPSGDPKDPYDCEDVDAVTASVIIGGHARDIGVYCGSKRPPMLMSNDNRMEVVFQSRSGSTTAQGFKAIYKFVTDFGISTGQQDQDMVCGFMFRSESAPNGTFTSPNFPGLYPRNTECHYLFYGRDNERIYITFPYFDVEGIPPACVDDTQSDYVEFSNFNIKLKDRKMNRFCGTKEEHVKKAVNSDGNFFRVTFKSNDVYDATGFEAFYQFRKYEDPFHGKIIKPGSAIKPTISMATLILPLAAVCLQWWS